MANGLTVYIFSDVYHLTMYTGGVPVQYVEQPTNGVTYFRAISGISMLPEDLMVYVPLFCAVITQLVHNQNVYVQLVACSFLSFTEFTVLTYTVCLFHHERVLSCTSTLFCRMGAGDLDHRQFAQQCDLYTGGLHVSPHVAQHHTNMCGYDQGVLFTSHCLDRHLPYMLSLWEDIFTRYACSAMD